MPLYSDDKLACDSSESVVKEQKQNEGTWVKFPFEIKYLDPQVNQQLMNDFTGVPVGFLQVGPKKYILPGGYEEHAEDLYNFQLRVDDVFVTTFSRSGTTWMQELVWLLCNNLDYEKAAAIPLDTRFPFLERSAVVHKKTQAKLLHDNIAEPAKYKEVQELFYPTWKSLSKSRERRFIKSHLPISLMPPTLTKCGCKVIYIARNPKDVAVSYYHLCKSVKAAGYSGDFPKYWYYFQNNLLNLSPYWEHIKEAWKLRHEANVLFIFYEDMNKNLRHSIEKVAEFLGVSYTSQQLDVLENHLKFDNFKNNGSVNNYRLRDLGIHVKNGTFIRKGIIGGWRDYFDQELEKRADQWIEENLRDTDLRFSV